MPWLFFVVFLPALAPLMCLALSLLPFKRRLLVASRGLVRPLALFKDGQLGWLGGALCAAAILELRERRRIAVMVSVDSGMSSP